MKIAVVGTGISGLVAAYLLSRTHDVSVFESNGYVGGHTHTVDVSVDGETYPVDTGFIVYNETNYPNFSRLLDQLGVETRPSDMSFSVCCERTGLEYSGPAVNGLFAQRKNLLRPRFYRMLLDTLRFYRESVELLSSDDHTLTLGDYLSVRNYSDQFVDHHIVPMGSAIWSSGSEQILKFPARYFVDFFRNHGFLNLRDRTEWRTVKGGSRRYVEALTRSFADRIHLDSPITAVTRDSDKVMLRIAGREPEFFDRVIIATHSDQALAILTDPTEQEREILGSMAYQANETVLHTDSSLLPKNRRAWASWNYRIPVQHTDQPSVTYYMNSLQSFETSRSFCVTLNQTEQIDPARVISRMTYDHPVYTVNSVKAQSRWSEINGQKGTYFCGAYWGYGFHEDGVNSALRVCSAFGKDLRNAA